MAKGIPLYVVEIDPQEHRVVVGSKDELGRRDLAASRVNWIAGQSPDGRVRAAAQIRHRHTAAPGWLDVTGADTAAFTFDEPQNAVTPGQAVVFYDGDEVIAGGWIER